MSVQLDASLGDSIEAAAVRVRPHAALYIGGMGSRETNFYHRIATNMGFGREADEIQDLYLARDYAGAAAAVPLEFISRTSLLGDEASIAESRHGVRRGRDHQPEHRGGRGRSAERRQHPRGRRERRPPRGRPRVTWLEAIILGIVEGLTEFLPVSSTGHLTIAAKLMGLHVDDRSITAFTAVIQVGAILAVVIYFWSDIVRLFLAWGRGLFNAERADGSGLPDGLAGHHRLDADRHRRFPGAGPDQGSVAVPVGGRRRADHLGRRDAARRARRQAGPAGARPEPGRRAAHRRSPSAWR